MHARQNNHPFVKGGCKRFRHASNNLTFFLAQQDPREKITGKSTSLSTDGVEIDRYRERRPG